MVQQVPREPTALMVLLALKVTPVQLVLLEQIRRWRVRQARPVLTQPCLAQQALRVQQALPACRSQALRVLACRRTACRLRWLSLAAYLLTVRGRPAQSR